MNQKFAKSAYGYFLIWGVLSSFATAICTIVDALLVGNIIGSDGLAVVNISTPVFLVYALFGITIGVGANVHIGRFLGASEIDRANNVFASQITVGLVIAAICLCPLLFKDSFFRFLGVTEALYPLAEQYLTVVMWSAPIFVMYHILSVSVRTDSDPKLSAIASAVVIITNLTLDLLFMGVLDFGIIGASASLCIAEGLGILILSTHFLKKRALLKVRLAIPKAADIKNFVVNGFAVGSANVFLAVVMLVFNTTLLRSGQDNGSLYVAIYGVMYTVSTIPFAVFDGSANALSTVSAFLTGESDTKGVFVVLKRAITVTAVCGAVLSVLCIVFAEQLVWFFGIHDAASIEIAASPLRFFSVSFMFTGVNTVATAFWQSIGRAKIASIMSVTRNCLMMLCVGIALIPNMHILGLSLTYICTEVLCTLIAIAVMLLGTSKKYVQEKYGAKGKCFENDYLIELESTERITSDLERICEEWDIGMKQAFFFSFICEELLLNIIKFAVSDTSKKHYISIKLMEKEGDYVLRIRDNVRSYNPFESSGDEIDSGVLKLIRKKSKFCDYQRKMIFNYLYMVI